MMRKWTTRYGLAAVLVAVLIISVAFVANPSILPKSSFTVLLTDPPNVPAGTTALTLTYSDVALHVVDANGAADWISVGTSGTINSLSLVNMSQTIASTSIQINSFVDKIQLTITGVTAVINGVTYNVTTLSNTLVMAIANSQINQKLSGVLVDFNPTLVQIQSTGTDGNSVNSYVLVPSATATIVNNLDPAQGKVGAIHNLGPNDRNRMAHLADDFSSSISIESASLSVNGNSTSLSVTLKNNGNSTFRIFGLMLQGQYNVPIGGGNGFPMPGQDNSIAGSNMGTVPFQISGTSLVPFFGPGAGTQPMEPQNVAANPTMGQSQGMPPVNLQNTAPNQPAGIGDGLQPMPIQNGGPQLHNSPPEMNGTQLVGPQNGPHDDRTGNAASSYLALQPGQTVTLSFSSIIALPQSWNNAGSAITPIVGNNYTVQLMGEGFQTYTVTATS